MIQNNPQPGAMKALFILHRALLAGMLMFGVIGFFLSYSGSFSPVLQPYDRILQVVVIAVCAGGYFGGNQLFKSKLASIRDSEESLAARFSQYRAACIIQWALMEGPCLLSTVLLMLTGNLAYAGVIILFILLFIAQGPSYMKAALHLVASEDDLKQL